MIVGAALLVSGLAFLLGALCATRWGPADDELPWLYAAGSVMLLLGLVAPFVEGSLPRVSLRSPRVRFIAGVVVVVGAVYASSRVGVPKTLPGITLGWSLLFHIERGSALIAAAGLVALVLWRGAHGEWPISVGNLFQYAPKEAVEVTANALEEQDDRIAIIEGRLGLSRPQQP